ncbi:unnamed protein product [Leptosia nina]|uniref:Uncharacterized protein n=1 Tax=Leptosia nina TaxID=320188 RepID=A0AAV1J9V3_9NEOP
MPDQEFYMKMVQINAEVLDNYIDEGAEIPTMFRSEEMVLCQLFVQPEAAYVSMYELGEAGIAQFRDVYSMITRDQKRNVSFWSLLTTVDQSYSSSQCCKGSERTRIKLKK